MICILYICLHCTYIHINSSEHEWQMCGWINNVHTVFTLSVVKYLVMFFFLPSTRLTTLFCVLISSLCFLLYLPLIHFLPFLPCFHSPLSWYHLRSGPEPPTNIVFSEVTENSLTVSWTKPKSPISGFKVTYVHAEDGESWHSCFICHSS